ncbi:MAG: EI24 domain-containing protein [Paracoccaceae bacterium]
MGMIADFLRAAGQLTDARFAGVLAWALALTLGLLAALSLGAVWLVGLLPVSFDLPLVGEVATPFSAVRGLALGAMVWLSAFLMFPVAAMFVSLMLDRIVDAVEARHYPELTPARPMGLAEAIRGGLGFALVVLAVNLVALIFYLLAGPFAPLVFWAVNGYLLGREYFELVALRRLEPDGMRRMRGRHGVRIWLAGALMAVPLSIPLLNLLVPVVGVATYTHMFHRLWRREDISAATAARRS